jgi:hypothetical protein
MPALKAVAVCVAAAVLGVVPGAAVADPWPRFRGPDGAGVATLLGESPGATGAAVPVKWTEADYLWKAALPGAGHSSPVVWGDKVFVTSGRPADAKRFVVALGAADGRVLWTREFDSARAKMNPLNSYGSASPAADAERVYACWAGQDRYVLVALDHAGRDVWSRDLGPFMAEHGHGASPVVVDGLVIVANASNASGLTGVDARTGAIVCAECGVRSAKCGVNTRPARRACVPFIPHSAFRIPH